MSVTVTRLSVTPIKGMQLADRESIELGPGGVSDNRRFYLIDERGLMFNGKRDGRLVAIFAEYDQLSERLALRFPDGTRVSERWTAGDPVTTNFYGRPVDGHLVLGPWSQAISAFIGQVVRLVAVDRLGEAVDVHPVTVVSQASIEALRASTRGAEQLDYRRFRMLVEIDGIDANEEDTWVGRHVTIGSARVEIIGPVPRCVVVSQNPEGGERDFDTLGAIIAYRGTIARELITPTAHLPDGGKVVFGVYGHVVEAGRVRVGDTVNHALIEVANNG